jgi:hypothetical protein
MASAAWAEPQYPVTGIGTLNDTLLAPGSNFGGLRGLQVCGVKTCVDQGGGNLYPCTTCSVDNLTVYQDSKGNKWQRQFSGAVNVQWSPSFQDARSSPCLTTPSSCDLTSAINAGWTNARLYGNGDIDSFGASVNVSGYIAPPAGQSFGCSNPLSGIQSQSQSSLSTAFWTAPGSVVFLPSTSGSGIASGLDSLVHDCMVRSALYSNTRPAGYTSGTNAIPTTVHDAIIEKRVMFQGNPVVGRGTGSNFKNLTIMMADTGLDHSSSQQSTTENILLDSNTGLFTFNQRGGFLQHDIVRDATFYQRLTDPTSGLSISVVQWTITGVEKDSATGGIILDIDNSFYTSNICPTVAGCLMPGVQIDVSNLGSPSVIVNTSGVVHASADPADCGVDTPYCITNVPTTVGNGNDGINAIQPKSSIQDTGSAGCVFPSTVTNKDVDAQTVWTGASPTGCATDPTGQEALRFTGSSAGPAGGNGSYLTGAITDGTTTGKVLLVGSSYDGPIRDGVKWQPLPTGFYSLSVYDIHNVAQGVYVCKPGSITPAPFCETYAEFQGAPSTADSIAALTTGIGILKIGNPLGWPDVAVFQIDDSGSGGCLEKIAYKRNTSVSEGGLDTNQIVLTARGWDNTTICTHINGTAVTVSAPQVSFVIPHNGDLNETAVAIIGAPVPATGAVTNTTGSPVWFANDNTVTTGLAGQLVLNNVYSTRSQNMHNGSGPFGAINAEGTTSNGSPNITLAESVGYVQPGMTVSDDYGDVPANTSITMHITASINSFQAAIISQTGTPYPGMKCLTATGLQGDSLIEAVEGSTVVFSHMTTLAMTNKLITCTGTVVTAVDNSTGIITINANATGSHSPSSSPKQHLHIDHCGYPHDPGTGVPWWWAGDCLATGVTNGSLTDQSTQGFIGEKIRVHNVGVGFMDHNAPATIVGDFQFDNGSGVSAQIDTNSTDIVIDGFNTNFVRFSNGRAGGDFNGIFIDANTSASRGITFSGFQVSPNNIGIALIGLGGNASFEGTGDTGAYYVSHNWVGAMLHITSPTSLVYSDLASTFNVSQLDCSGIWRFAACSNGSSIVVGNPPGGDLGPGSINTTAGVSKNGSEYLYGNLAPQGRLSLVSGTPVPAADVTGATSVYYPTYTGGYASVYNGVGFNQLAITNNEVSQGLSTAHFLNGNLYDFVGINNGGALAICHGPAWNTATSRGVGGGSTALALISGIYTNAVAFSDCWGGPSGTTDYGVIAAHLGTYLGTGLASADGQISMVLKPAATAGGGAPMQGLWNAYNRVTMNLTSVDNGAPNHCVTCGNAQWEPAGSSGTGSGLNNRGTFVQGLPYAPIRATLNIQSVTYGTGATFPGVGIDLDQTTNAPGTGCSITNTLTSAVSETVFCDFYPVLGKHFVQAVSHASVNDSTFTPPLKLITEVSF